MASEGTRIAKKNSATIVAFAEFYHNHNDENNYFAPIMMMIKRLIANNDNLDSFGDF